VLVGNIKEMAAKVTESAQACGFFLVLTEQWLIHAGTPSASLPLTTTISSLLAVMAVGGLYYQTPYTNIVIIHLPMFISAHPLRWHLFLSYAGCVNIVPHVQYL